MCLQYCVFCIFSWPDFNCLQTRSWPLEHAMVGLASLQQFGDEQDTGSVSFPDRLFLFCYVTPHLRAFWGVFFLSCLFVWFVQSLLNWFEDVPLVEFMYLVFIHVPSESYRRWLRSLLLCVKKIECWLTPLCADSAQAIWIFCRRFTTDFVGLNFTPSFCCPAASLFTHTKYR